MNEMVSVFGVTQKWILKPLETILSNAHRGVEEDSTYTDLLEKFEVVQNSVLGAIQQLHDRMDTRRIPYPASNSAKLPEK